MRIAFPSKFYLGPAGSFFKTILFLFLTDMFKIMNSLHSASAHRIQHIQRHTRAQLGVMKVTTLPHKWLNVESISFGEYHGMTLIQMNKRKSL